MIHAIATLALWISGAEPAERKMDTWVDAPALTLPAFDGARAWSLYNANCRICHGAKGKGNGAAGRYLNPPPRDFTRGVYKFRSTQTGVVPTEQDLFDTLTRGLPGTSMWSWRSMPVDEIWQLVMLVKSFSPKFQSDPATEVLAIPPAPPSTPDAIVRGKKVWDAMQCATCHGDDGRGWGPAAKTSKDDQGRPSYPFNLTRAANYRIGAAPADQYRTLFTGLDGTAMPSYSGAMSEDEAWDLVHFVRSLAVDGSRSTP